MVSAGVLNDMGRQRMLQCFSGCLAFVGFGLWFYNVTILSYAVGAYIAALGIVFFAVATVHWFDDEEKLEEEAEKGGELTFRR